MEVGRLVLEMFKNDQNYLIYKGLNFGIFKKVDLQNQAYLISFG